MLDACFTEDHGHDGAFVGRAACAMGSEGRIDREVGDEVAVNNDEVVGEDCTFAEVTHGIADGTRGRADKLDLREGRRGGGVM